MSCAGRGLAMRRSPIQRVLPTVSKIHSFRLILNANRPEGLIRQEEEGGGGDKGRKQEEEDVPLRTGSIPLSPSIITLANIYVGETSEFLRLYYDLSILFGH
jgi:hypothetical protein